MKQSYLKYIETTEMIDEGPTSGITRLQHVGVVAVLDENGDEWFPEETGPLEVDNPSSYGKDNVYKWGETITAETATFKGGEEPYEIWARGRYKLEGDSEFTDTPKIFYDNTSTLVTFTIPENTVKVGFFTACNDSQNPNTAKYINSTLPVIDVLGLDPKIGSTSPQNLQSVIPVESGKRVRLDVYAEVNYTPLYYWQFKYHSDGKWKMSSDLEYYYPDSVILLSDGHRTMSYNLTWVSGYMPTRWRCKVVDKYDVYTYKEIYTNDYQLSFN